MEVYQILVVALLILAVVDLIVGVSNDAVNFLNSAIGSKVAARNVILSIAAAGVLVGALSSNGMMEIARKGIFNPSLFTFADVMVIFVAVMVADILLLDVFNSLGMPTSTTVSIVFDLLGASVAVALFKIAQSSTELTLTEAINYETAFAIISGIFLSVGIAFTSGSIIQYLCRLLFSFDYQKHLKTYGVFFASLAITIIVYFLLIKGAKGSVLISPETSDAMQNNLPVLLGIIFTVCGVVIFICNRFFNFHPLKVVVFAGTFSLAMAFAGNDLVNFVGVPLAGYQSFQMWSTSGESADLFLMIGLAEAVQTPFFFLLLAGSIMVITLWFSGKAKKVTETEVNLSRQDIGTERFQPNFLSRAIVNSTVGINKWISNLLPENTLNKINFQFAPAASSIAIKDRPAFDLVRASVNLVVASLLIALATSYKLPLSTTYVSFMVAMGSSLADRAWGAESAASRVAGVLNVVGGWLLTAIMAFTAAGVLAAAIFYGGPWVGVVLAALALVVFVRSNIRFKRKEKLGN